MLSSSRQHRPTRRVLFRLYWRLEEIITPGLEYSQRSFARLLKLAIPEGAIWLDAGCGRQVFAEWMLAEEQDLARRCRIAVGVDVDFESLKRHRTFRNRLMARLEALPLRTNTFDVVTANMVMEHVDGPQLVLGELHRILKPGGKLIFHTPNLRNWKIWLMARCPKSLKTALARLFEGRHREDVYPTHYLLNTGSAIQHHAQNAGFILDEIRFLESSATTAVIPPLLYWSC